MSQKQQSVMTNKGLIRVGDAVKYVGEDPEYVNKQGLVEEITGDEEKPYLYVALLSQPRGEESEDGEESEESDAESPVEDWERI